jgi:pyruvate, water dikinase
MTDACTLSTGLAGLDDALTGIQPGDNVVWQTDTVEPYASYVESLRLAAGATPIHYFRFAGHGPLLAPGQGIQIHELDPGASFEGFIASIHAVVQQAGFQAYHVFDCLSDLAADWYSDTMLGNFFRLTCPFVYQVGSLAYFCVLRNTHSSRSLDPIQATAQIVIDVYQHGGKVYIHPLKVDKRHAPTMHLLHEQRGDQFAPVTMSATVADVLNGAADHLMEPAGDRPGVWRRTFRQAGELFRACRDGHGDSQEADRVFGHLLRMTIARSGPMLELAHRYLTREDVVQVGRRLIGSGLIGGKSVGMLLARAILRQASPRVQALVEPHDSFYVGSDVFYSFLVENDIWWARQQQSDPRTFMKGADVARERILVGSFPEYMEKQFGQVLDYFGQSPFIVRSSSLLEDNFGNAFSGKYESAFCVNQGERSARLGAFVDAVRGIYASSMSPGALRYRAQRDLLGHDEQMALLVQRVSGSLRGRRFYPDAAGVGLSHNPYVWNRAIDPDAGLVRLVFGLGTRAVDRSDDDYTRIVALNVPEMRPESTLDEVRRYAQQKADVLDLNSNSLVTDRFGALAAGVSAAALELLSSRDQELERRVRQRGGQMPFSRVLTFDGLLHRTAFAEDMRLLLQALEQAYAYPVDVEFTVNLLEDASYRINVVQCRPLQVKEGGALDHAPDRPAGSRLLLESGGPVIGRSRSCEIGRVVYVHPTNYARLTQQERYTVARLIGRITHAPRKADGKALAIIGPGRWGTTTPSLGVPVSFAEIDTASVLCEVVAMDGDLVPDVSLGTHFFNDLIEADILYLALFPERQGHGLGHQAMEAAPNALSAILPDAAAWESVIRVIDPDAEAGALLFHADSLAQRVLCFWADPEGSVG